MSKPFVKCASGTRFPQHSRSLELMNKSFKLYLTTIFLGRSLVSFYMSRSFTNTRFSAVCSSKIFLAEKTCHSPLPWVSCPSRQTTRRNERAENDIATASLLYEEESALCEDAPYVPFSVEAQIHWWYWKYMRSRCNYFHGKVVADYYAKGLLWAKCNSFVFLIALFWLRKHDGYERSFFLRNFWLGGG